MGYPCPIRMKVKCDYCEVEFNKPPSKVKKSGHNFCCKEHYAKWMENKEEKHKRICALCNKVFEDNIINRLEWHFSAHLSNEHQVPIPSNVKEMPEFNKHFDTLHNEEVTVS